MNGNNTESSTELPADDDIIERRLSQRFPLKPEVLKSVHIPDCFPEAVDKVIQNQIIDLSKLTDCWVMKETPQRVLRVVSKNNTIYNIFTYFGIDFPEEELTAVISSSPGSIQETIYNVASGDKVLISITLSTGEVCFLLTSVTKVNPPPVTGWIDKQDPETDSQPVEQIHEIKYHFMLFTEWLKNYSTGVSITK